MPAVPVLDENQIAPTPVTGAKVEAADYGAAGEQVGAAVARFGQAGTQAVDAEDRINQVYDEAGAKRLTRQYGEAIRDPLLGKDGFFSQEGINAVNAKDGIVKTLGDTRDSLLEQATNPRMKRMAQDGIGALYANNMDAITRHASTQGIQWGVAESQGLQEMRRNDAISHADDPTLFAANVGAGLHEIDKQAELNGTAGTDMVAAQKAKWLSGLHVDVADAKTLADPVGAKAWIDAHRGDMIPTDYAKVSNGLYRPLLDRKTTGNAQVLVADALAEAEASQPKIPDPAGGSAGSPTALGSIQSAPGALISRMVPITSFSESRNHETNADGSVVTSSAGAQGSMQVMPGTNTDPGFGVRPAQDNSLAERARVGRDYLRAMMTRYGNDPAKAWAAYNAGPGSVDNAVKGGGDWLSKLPKETQTYVGKNMAALGGGALGGSSSVQVAGGVAVDATPHVDMDKIHQKILNDPTMSFDEKEMTWSKVKSQLGDMETADKSSQDDAKDNAFAVIAALGAGNFKSMSQLPPKIVRDLSPSVVVSLEREAASNAAPTAVPEHGPIAMNLKAEADINPETFAARDLRVYSSQMNPAEYDQLTTLQRAIQKKANDPIVATHHSVWGTIAGRATEAGIDLKKNKDGTYQNSETLKKVGTISDLMTTELNNATEGKRAPRPDEVDNAFDHAIMRVNVRGPDAFWTGQPTYTSQPRYAVPGAPVPVQNTAIPRIKQIFGAVGNHNPTEQQMSQMYLRFKGKPGYWK